MKKIITAFVAVLLVFSVAAPAANAQVYYTNYSPRSQEETIVYLQAIVAQLIAQLEARGFGIQYHYNYDGYRNYGQYRSSQVRQNWSYDSDVEVETRYASYSDDEVKLYGSVDLRNSSYAYVWFEYGEDDDMDEDTPQKKVTRDSTFSATLDVDDLDEDEFYYYRAVAKDDDGDLDFGVTRSFYVSDGGSSSSDDDEPEAYTYSARDVDDDSAELRGKVDMNDFRNGYVFFVYGEDEDQVEDVEDEDEYRDIDEDGDNLQKVVADTDLDDDRTYWYQVRGLDDNTDYYYRICVEYEDEDDDETLECGDVEHFETD